jgi:hypothetical protein
MPRVKAAASEAAYWTAYALTFAAIFQWTVARKLAPECVKRGYRDAVKEGRDAAERWVDEITHKTEHAPTAPAAEARPSDGAEPGIA